MEEVVDLSLVLGTSLSGMVAAGSDSVGMLLRILDFIGMNADRMAVTPAKRSLKGKALGAVVINLQKTHLDAKCAVRVWAKLDDAFRLLAQKLGMIGYSMCSLGHFFFNLIVGIEKKVLTKAIPLNLPDNDVAVVPYDADGKLDHNSRMLLDLRENAKIRIPIEGAMNANCTGYMYKKKGGHYQVVIHEEHGPVVYVLISRT